MKLLLEFWDWILTFDSAFWHLDCVFIEFRPLVSQCNECTAWYAGVGMICSACGASCNQQWNWLGNQVKYACLVQVLPSQRAVLLIICKNGDKICTLLVSGSSLEFSMQAQVVTLQKIVPYWRGVWPVYYWLWACQQSFSGIPWHWPLLMNFGHCHGEMILTSKLHYGQDFHFGWHMNGSSNRLMRMQNW